MLQFDESKIEKFAAKTLHIRVTCIEEILGTCSAVPDIHDEFIASKAPDAPSREEEVAAIGVEAVAEKSKTVFARDEDGTPILWDYQLKGFFKDACSMLNRCAKKGEDGKKKAVNESSKLTAFKKAIDGQIFVFPRRIRLEMPEGGQIGDCQRPLRAQTAQGERVALANSETVPEGTTFEIKIVLLSADHEAAVREWLDYGVLRGLCQWRNSGKGRFVWEEIA